MHRVLSGLMVVMATACAAAPPTDIAASGDLPDYKPETAAACNAVGLNVELGVSGAIMVNGVASSLDGVKQAAARKNDACRNAPAMVMYTVSTGTAAGPRDAIRDTLSQVIVNLTLVEVTKG